ncbi:hypothetical protein VE01_10625 [Pseudogymnoascus verrucosus]|uniref:Zn(2)-C6 fungal-type domain-containing protein n=1 Tax=Pseudogymnoascus verrucosus TaxID=342668 RepID=A0A1B8G6D0_9PEZI|nr:uncharacterized protein VE01_10625 [Pseudogymnoascus verrucosus]OBT91389.2 hypothetical protein VE01_10625 [Pseudogymnoascus verrucosus]
MEVPEPSSMIDLRVRRRACLSCTSAKVKCTSASLGAESCARCERLGKGCVYADPSSEAKRNRREVSSAKRLEEKVDMLSTQIATLTQDIRSTSFQGPRCNRPTEILHSSSSSLHDRISGSHFASSGFLPRSRDVHNDILTDVVQHDLGGLAAADLRLETFRQGFVHYFPFVVVPPTVSPEALRCANPFLFLCIMAVTSFEDTMLQRRLGLEIKKQICDRLVMGHEASIDLLQGLLVFVAWYQYFCVPGKHQYFLMVQLCVSMCHELRLDLNEKGKRGLEEAETQGKTRDPAEMRALLGTYCLSSMLSMALRKRTLMHYTSYMENCCTYLSGLRDVPSDQLIMPFVEIQVLQRKISDAFCYYDISACAIRGERALQITVDSFSREIDGLKKSIGLTNRNVILVQNLRFLEVWNHEVALYNELWQSTFVSDRLAPLETNHSIQLSMQRTNMLWQLVAATVSFHDWCLSVENAELLHFPLSWWTELSYVFIVQVKTVFLDCGAGTMGQEQINLRGHGQAESLEADFRRVAAKEVMIPRMLDLYMGKLAEVTTQLVDDDGIRDMAYNYGIVLKSIQSGYESRIGAENRLAPGQFETQQKQSSLSQMSHPQVRITDIQGSMPPALNTSHVELEIDNPRVSSASQLDLQFDLAGPVFDDFVWDTMMNDFSFLMPQNGSSF